MDDKIIYNIIKDFQKRDINIYERGKIVEEYMKRKKISLRKLAKELDISHTTLHTWLSFAKNLKKGQYEELLQNGTTKQEIYSIAKAKFKGQNTNPIDIILSRARYLITQENAIITEKTIQRAQELKIELDKIIETKNIKKNK